MKKFLTKNIYLLSILVIYSFLMLLVLNWGIPNYNHPFTYHMDEWHQMQAIKNLFIYGTNNMEGSAHGPVLHFFLGGIFLTPFILTGYIDPFSISSSLQNIAMQGKIFQLLRIDTLLFGIGSIIILWKTIKDNFKISPFIPVSIFAFSPIWLSLSNYFKYDIALIFWLLLTLLTTLNYRKKPVLKNFIFASFFSGLALSTKISAAPIFLVLIFSYFLFTLKIKNNLKTLLLGAIIFFVTFVIFGIFDLVFLGKGDYYVYLYDNLVTTPKVSAALLLGIPWYFYILFVHYPLIFGWPLYFLFLASIFYLIVRVKEKFAKYLLFSIVVFCSSLVILKIDLRGNRSLVLLPFFILSITYLLEEIKRKVKKGYFTVLLCVLIIIQIAQSLPFVFFKLTPDIKETSSAWIKQNIKKEELIGLQNIPIYQGMSDLLLKDYYQSISGGKAYYEYQIIDSNVKNLPKTIILTNTDFNKNIINDKEENKLLQRLKKEKYILYKKFNPDLSYFYSNFDDLLFSGMIPITSISIYEKQNEI